MTNGKCLYWVDLETTGLDEEKCSILEVSVFEAKFMDPFNAKQLYHSEVYLPYVPDCPEAKLDPFVINMHTKNGLFTECRAWPKPRDIDEIEEDLLELIPQVQSKEMMPHLAGSSIHFDAKFINKHMPTLARRFSHRHYDVSALKLFCQSKGMPEFKKSEAHRATADILESIEHAKQCDVWLSAQPRRTWT